MKRAFQKATLDLENLILLKPLHSLLCCQKSACLKQANVFYKFIMKGDIKMSNVFESLGNMNSVEAEKDMMDNIYSPFEDGKWWENDVSEDERVLDYRFNKFWKVAVYRGCYSKRTKGQGYAVKVKSKIGDLTELTYLFDDFVNNFDRVCKGEMAFYGFLDKEVIKDLHRIALNYKCHDMVGDDKNHVIVLDPSVDNALDILLDRVSADNLIDKYYNNLIEYIKENHESFASRTSQDATPDVQAAWLDDDVYKSKYKQETLAIREKELKNFVGRKDSDSVLMKEIVTEFVERGYILPGKNFAKDITLSADAKDIRCYVININRAILGI